MSRVQRFMQSFTMGFMLPSMLFAGVVQAKEKDCWADFYEDAQYKGEHIRMQGPAELAQLQNVNGENWSMRIDSIKVGPKAKVTVFENPNYKLTLTEMAKFPELMHSLGITEQDIREDSELIFGAGVSVHSLAEYNFHDKVKSLKVECSD
ncbi:MAG: beta/gamma crystallin domain-containing protein [Gammaproteobacteria bacterium]